MKAQLATGTWVDMLVELALPYRQPLRELLHQAPVIDGEHVSEKLRAALVRIDSAVLTCERRAEALACRAARAVPSPPPVAPDGKAKAKAELSRLGVKLS